MAERSMVVTTGGSHSRLPDRFIPGVVLLEHLRKQGVLEEVGERFRVYRQGGFPALDAFVFLLLFFAGQEVSLRGFAEFMRPWRSRLGSLAGRKTIMHQSSLSRLCSAMTYENIRASCAWLLLKGCGGFDLLSHPSTGYFSGEGTRWDVFDFDPSVVAIRRRGLPSYESNVGPEGRRRATQAKPGYRGRHRGEVTVSRKLLRHAGSGLWLGCEVEGGTGGIRAAFERAVDIVVSVCNDASIPKSQAIMRCDGAFGYVPYIDACMKADIQIVTRLAHYGLFERDEIRCHLANATWMDVTDSKSGPRRQATDLGTVTLTPSNVARRGNGSSYQPTDVRVIVTRTQTENDRGAGVRVNGEWYELFGTTLAVNQFPAEDIVSLFSGRANIENGIEQVHQLCNLDRLYSNRLPGQEFITNVGLMVYNLQTVLGTQIEHVPDAIPQQNPRTQFSKPWVAPKLPSKSSENVREQAEDTFIGSQSEAEQQLGVVLDNMPWPSILGRTGEGWRRQDGKPFLLCPQGHPLWPRLPMRYPNRKPRIMFAPSKAACLHCPKHDSCTGGRERRRISYAVNHDLALSIEHAVRRYRKARDNAAAKTAVAEAANRTPTKKGYSFAWTPISLPDKPLMELATPLFLGGESRKTFREQLDGVGVSVDVHMPISEAPPRLIAASPVVRQRRRKTWDERLRYNALPNNAKVDLQINLARLSPWFQMLYDPITPSEVAPRSPVLAMH